MANNNDDRLKLVASFKGMDEVTLDIIKTAGVDEMNLFFKRFWRSYEIGIVNQFLSWIETTEELFDDVMCEVVRRNDYYVDSSNQNDRYFAEQFCNYTVEDVAYVASNHDDLFDEAPSVMGAILTHINNAMMNGTLNNKVYDKSFKTFCVDIIEKAEEAIKYHE